MPGYRLRPLVPQDGPTGAALIRAAFSVQAVQTDPPSSALQENAETVAAQIATGGGAGAEAQGCLVGLVLWVEREGGLYFGRLAVLPAWRGRGIAWALIAAAEAEARRRGMPRVHLSTRLVLADNRRLFAACGFRETERRTHAGYDAPTSVVMEKFLRGSD